MRGDNGGWIGGPPNTPEKGVGREEEKMRGGKGGGKDKFGDRLFVYLPQHRRWVLDPEKPQGLRSKSKQEFTRNY